MTEQADFVVIGLGAMGSAILYQLAKRGAHAIGVDRFAPPHRMGSSHGETRITRQAVGEGGDYAPLVLNSHRIWRELEADTGERLLNACGVLVMAPGKTLTLDDVRAYLAEQGIAKMRWPERLEFVDAMPMTASRKIIKGKLIEQLGLR